MITMETFVDEESKPIDNYSQRDGPIVRGINRRIDRSTENQSDLVGNKKTGQSRIGHTHQKQEAIIPSKKQMKGL